MIHSIIMHPPPFPPNPLLTISHSSRLIKPPPAKPTSLHSLSYPPLAEAPSISTVPAAPVPPEDGPVELSRDLPSVFTQNDETNPVQVSTTVVLTGALTVFLFRSVRRRVKRAKQERMRSSGAKKTMKEEALASLKAMGKVEIKPKKGPPSPVDALVGAVIAGVIALFLYKFTTNIEEALNRQTVSNNYSVRQITITIRTIINGLCYLATFVYGINAVGLFLYSGQLALSPIFDGSTIKNVKTNERMESSSLNLSSPESSKTSGDSDQIS